MRDTVVDIGVGLKLSKRGELIFGFGMLVFTFLHITVICSPIREFRVVAIDFSRGFF